MRLRQVAMVAQDLEPRRAQLFELFGIEADFADRGVAEFGLQNSVMALADSFFEIVAPQQPNTAAQRTLEREQQDACGYMVLFQVDRFETFAQHLDQLKLRQVWQIERPEVSACHIHPKDIGGAIVSFDEMRPAESWLWGGPNWQHQQAAEVNRIVGCTLSSPNPAALAQHWSTVLQTPLDTQQLRLPLQGETFVEFEEADHERLHRVTIAAPDPQGRRAMAAELGLGSYQQPSVGALQLSFV